MKSKNMKNKRNANLYCPHCGMSISIRLPKSSLTNDFVFVCCGDRMKIKK
ncbi:MAG: hypothetical protein ABIK33_04710 [candidate division WOR-3 bacterium]